MALTLEDALIDETDERTAEEASDCFDEIEAKYFELKEAIEALKSKLNGAAQDVMTSLEQACETFGATIDKLAGRTSQESGTTGATGAADAPTNPAETHYTTEKNAAKDKQNDAKTK